MSALQLGMTLQLYQQLETELGISSLPELIFKAYFLQNCKKELEVATYRNIGLVMKYSKTASLTTKRFLEPYALQDITHKGHEIYSCLAFTGVRQHWYSATVQSLRDFLAPTVQLAKEFRQSSKID